MTRLARPALIHAAIAAAAACSTALSDPCKTVPIEGEVSETAPAAVSIPPSLLLAASRTHDAIRSELRILDSSGRPVPFAIRPAASRTVETVPEFHPLAIVSAAETNDTLVVDASWPSGDIPQRFMSLRVSTPLSDFEEQVDVYADGRRIGGGTVCDRSRFADVRVDTVPLPSDFHRKLRVVFSKPTSEQSSPTYERSDSTDPSGESAGTVTRRTVSERAFRIDSLSVSIPVERTKSTPLPPWKIPVDAKPRPGKDESITLYHVDAAFLPVCGVTFDVGADSSSCSIPCCSIAVGRRFRDNDWINVASGPIYSKDYARITGNAENTDELRFPSSVREGNLLVSVTRFSGDGTRNSQYPLAFSVEREDAIFLAYPGERYSLALEKGANGPGFDPRIFDAMLSKRDAVRMTTPEDNAFTVLHDADSPSGFLNPVAVASVAAFVALGIACLLLFRRQNRQDAGAGE